MTFRALLGVPPSIPVRHLRALSILGLLGLWLGLTPWMGGCAVVDTFHQCGLGGCSGDAAITMDVRARFSAHPSIEAPNLIDVQTLAGVVYLYGLVDTEMERDLAGAVAGGASGVRRVVNNVSINNASY